MRPLRWWAESTPPGWDRVKVSENLGATAVAPVAPVNTSLKRINIFLKIGCPVALGDLDILVSSICF